MNLTTTQIHTFIYEITQNNFSRYNYVMRYITDKHTWFFQERNFTNTIRQPNLLRFLVSKPNKNNSFYRNHRYNLLKTRNFSIAKELEEYYSLNIHFNYTNYKDIYYQDFANSSYSVQKIIQNFFKGITFMNLFLFIDFLVKEFVNDSIYKAMIPGFLYNWFTYEPKISIHNSKLTCEILSITIKEIGRAHV